MLKNYFNPRLRRVTPVAAVATSRRRSMKPISRTCDRGGVEIVPLLSMKFNEQ